MLLLALLVSSIIVGSPRLAIGALGALGICQVGQELLRGPVGPWIYLRTGHRRRQGCCVMRLHSLLLLLLLSLRCRFAEGGVRCVCDDGSFVRWSC